MVNLLSFRPSVIGNNTAFEAMTSIYKYLQIHYGYHFILVKTDEDNYQDTAFEVVSLPTRQLKFALSQLLLPTNHTLKQFNKTFARVDGILTVDPLIYDQGLLAIAKAHALKKPVWFDTSITSFEDPKSLNWRIRRRFFLKNALAQTSGIIATVPKCLERFQNIGILDVSVASKFTIMGHPVDDTLFIPKTKLSQVDGILRVLVVSRMIPEKGVYYILEAMTPLLQQQEGVQLQFLGSGVIRPLLEREVLERNLEDKVLFIDVVSRNELPSILGTADIFINHALSIASWEEFFGVVNLEAMACGLPCIITASGGIPYAVREQGIAICVEERNIIQLRQAIAYLLDSELARIEIGQKARNYVKGYYGLPVIAEKYHQMLQRGFSENEKVNSA